LSSKFSQNIVNIVYSSKKGDKIKYTKAHFSHSLHHNPFLDSLSASFILKFLLQLEKYLKYFSHFSENISAISISNFSLSFE